MEIITTKEVMDKLDMFQSIFGKIDKFGSWYLEIISSDAGTQFTSMEFQEKMSNPRCLDYVSSSRASGNERTSKCDIENIA